MKLSKLLNKILVNNNYPDTQITSITCDSRQVHKGTAFVCIKGENGDGHNHAAQALQKGAAVIFCQKDCGVPNQIIMPDTREAYGKLCAAFFDYPARSMNLIAVTGTNGKTTTSWLIEQTLEKLGKKAGLIGTICNRICGSSEEEGPLILQSHYTTPDAWELQALLRRMADRGCEFVVMEASSHALAQKRLEGCEFACGIFTNLTPEHLDFHKTMENYYLAKKELFRSCKSAIINLDDAYANRLAQELAGEMPITTFSVGNDSADFTARQVEIKAGGSRFVVVGAGGLARINIALLGEFSVSNALAACCALEAFGIKLQDIALAMSSCSGVPGRTEILENGEFTVIRDYAHTPDGLEKVLTAIRKFSSGKIITLFGCAGRRDSRNRASMAETVSRLSDLVIMTADNPRDEDIAQIFEDAKAGILSHNTRCKTFEDRKEAIIWGLKKCKSGDIFLLAGKGHEEYQVLADRTICFDEKKIVEDYLNKNNNN